MAKAKLLPGSVAGIIGGPPCQGFSTMGKRVADDPRNGLIEHFFRLVREIRPKFFLMENVPGLIAPRSRQTIIDALARTDGYAVVGPLIVDAHDLGAATRRKRVVVLGYDPAFFDPISGDDISSLRSSQSHTVRDAISDIPEPNDKPARAYKKIAKVPAYAARARALPMSGLGSKYARKLLKSGLVSGLQSTVHTEDVIVRFSSVAAGTTDKVSRCRRLAWHEPSPTLRAGTGPDRGSFQAIRPLHPTKHRVISVREGARLQGFPDWFTFHETKWHSFRMIGNSVSPIVAERLLNFIKERMKVSIGCDGNVGRTDESGSSL